LVRPLLQVKYDTLGKVKLEKPHTSVSQQPSTLMSGLDETVVVRAGPQCRPQCDCSLTSASDERPRITVDAGGRSQSSGSVCERRRPPPAPPSTDRRECRCVTTNQTDSHADHLQGFVDDFRYHHHQQHHRHSQQQQQQQQPHQQQLEQSAHQQRCSQQSVSTVCQQSQRHLRESSDCGGNSAVASCDADRTRSGGGGQGAERQCRSTDRQRRSSESSLLSNAELFQIDLFYRSRRTLVHVCPCPALLYFARCSAAAGAGGSSGWRYAAAGVPVVVADTLRVASGPRLHVVVAERGTGFELWRCGLAAGARQYAVAETSTAAADDHGGGGGAAFHTVGLASGDLAGLCFDDAASAGEFHRQLLRLDELYSAGGTGSRKKKGKIAANCRDRASGACHHHGISVHPLRSHHFNPSPNMIRDAILTYAQKPTLNLPHGTDN